MLNIDGFSSIEKVVRFFEEFSAIPHGSGNTSLIITMASMGVLYSVSTNK